MSLSALFDLLPPTHNAGPFDYSLGFLNVYLTALVFVTPCTPGWKLFRAAVATPIVGGIWLYLVLTPLSENDTDQWGIPILMTAQVMRTLEWFVFFPAEEHCHRLRPRSEIRSTHPHPTDPSHLTEIPGTPNSNSKRKHTIDADADETLVPEPIPAPWTWAKFWWGCSLWWAWRGIGWNYCCPLSPSSRQHPYTRNSSRRSFLRRKVYESLVAWIVFDLTRTYMNLSAAAPFFSGLGGAPTYASLTTAQRAIYSIAVAVRVWYSLARTHLLASIVCVSLGGLMGWQGEIWSPWGWPGVFGSMSDLWRHPGLSTMWSRTWQGYNRRWLYVFGWIGIGENVLHLTHTGISSRPLAPPPIPSSSTTSSRSSPTPSGAVSPSHPLPTRPSGSNLPLPTRTVSSRLMLQNLLKSFIVFFLSGLNHDITTLMLLIKYHRDDKTLRLSDLMVYTPFFVIQPVGLALEAPIKSAWRGWKSRRRRQQQQHSEWKNEKKRKSKTETSEAAEPLPEPAAKPESEPRWLIFLERAVGFAWTWIWLGWTAGWFVQGITRSGKFRRDGDNPAFPSFFGGVYEGRWMH